MYGLSTIWFTVGLLVLLLAFADTAQIAGSAIRQAVVYVEFLIAVLLLSFGGLFAGLGVIRDGIDRINGSRQKEPDGFRNPYAAKPDKPDTRTWAERYADGMIARHRRTPL